VLWAVGKLATAFGRTAWIFTLYLIVVAAASRLRSASPE
jgi:hypothetical protein